MDQHTGQKGDNDPIDVCEIGYKVAMVLLLFVVIIACFFVVVFTFFCFCFFCLFVFIHLFFNFCEQCFYYYSIVSFQLIYFKPVIIFLY